MTFGATFFLEHNIHAPNQGPFAKARLHEGNYSLCRGGFGSSVIASVLLFDRDVVHTKRYDLPFWHNFSWVGGTCWNNADRSLLLVATTSNGSPGQVPNCSWNKRSTFFSSSRVCCTPDVNRVLGPCLLGRTWQTLWPWTRLNASRSSA